MSALEEKMLPYGSAASEKFARAVASGEQILQDRDRVQVAITETVDVRIPEARRKLNEACERLSNEASSESASVGELRTARKAVSEGEETIEVAEARVRGLKTKLDGFAETVIEESYTVLAAASDFKQSVFEDFYQQSYLPAVAQFDAVMQEAMALLQALGRDTSNLLRTEVIDIQPGAPKNLLQGLQHESWRASPELFSLFATYKELLVPVERIRAAAERAIEARPKPKEAPRTVVTVAGFARPVVTMAASE